MTLHRDVPRRERLRRKREAAKQLRRDYDEDLAKRRPWLFPLLWGSAVVVVVAFLVYWVLTGV